MALVVLIALGFALVMFPTLRPHALLPCQSLQQIYQQERGIYGRLTGHRLPQGLDRFQGRSRTRRQQLPLLGPDISGLIDIAAGPAAKASAAAGSRCCRIQIVDLWKGES